MEIPSAPLPVNLATASYQLMARGRRFLTPFSVLNTRDRRLVRKGQMQGARIAEE